MSKDEVIAIRLPAEIKTEVEQWAAADDRSISSFVRRLIEAERARREAQAKSKKLETVAA